MFGLAAQELAECHLPALQVAADEAAMEDAEPAAFQSPPKRLKLDTSGVGKVPSPELSARAPTGGHACNRAATIPRHLEQGVLYGLHQ